MWCNKELGRTQCPGQTPGVALRLAEPPKDVRQRLECRYGGLRESRAQAQKAASQCFASGGWGAKQLRCQSSIQSTLSGSAEPPPTPAIRLGQLRPAFPSSPSSLFITLQSCIHVPSSPRHKLVDSPTCEASLTRRQQTDWTCSCELLVLPRLVISLLFVTCYCSRLLRLT